jgi:hypothetical protein
MASHSRSSHALVTLQSSIAVGGDYTAAASATLKRQSTAFRHGTQAPRPQSFEAMSILAVTTLGLISDVDRLERRAM